ncbi:hypothetical protein QBC35DRAFT_449743 [Podospora australis]|uniref:Peptidyl-tRNA hydrolase n=1 Tax=Podospora australis TaxID=1536484 RepID=A0AAN6WXT9_9PEZI|nr:hypothetical protein QBC35DRAFT_449743 [Podospora australis]
MRFSTTTLLALPLLAAAAESPFEQYKAKFQNFISSFGATTGSGDGADKAQVPVPASSSGKKSKKVVEPKKIETLTLENWKNELYGSIKPEAITPEEWVVFISGGNKTCFGHCGKAEEAFKDSAAKFAVLPQSPNLGYVNCDDQPVLCNSWSASTGVLWLFEMNAPPIQSDIYVKRLNLTTVTGDDIVKHYQAEPRDVKWRKFAADSYFHPFDGFFARYNLAVPLGYLFWGLNVVPSWAMMLGVSFLSRSMMNRNRFDGPPRGGAPAPAQ